MTGNLDYDSVTDHPAVGFQFAVRNFQVGISSLVSRRSDRWVVAEFRGRYFPVNPRLLPTPVTKSHPPVAVKPPAEPEVMSRKLLLPRLL